MNFPHVLRVVLFASLLSAYPAAAMNKCLDCFGFKKKSHNHPPVLTQESEKPLAPSFEQHVETFQSSCPPMGKRGESSKVESLKDNFKSLKKIAKDENKKNQLLSMTWGLLSKTPLPEEDQLFLKERHTAWETVIDFLFGIYIYQLQFSDAWIYEFDILNDRHWKFVDAYTIQDGLIKINHDYLGDGYLQERAFALNRAKKIIIAAIKSLGFNFELRYSCGDAIRLFVRVKLNESLCTQYAIEACK